MAINRVFVYTPYGVEYNYSASDMFLAVSTTPKLYACVICASTPTAKATLLALQ